MTKNYYIHGNTVRELEAPSDARGDRAGKKT